MQWGNMTVKGVNADSWKWSKQSEAVTTLHQWRPASYRLRVCSCFNNCAGGCPSRTHQPWHTANPRHVSRCAVSGQYCNTMNSAGEWQTDAGYYYQMFGQTGHLVVPLTYLQFYTGDGTNAFKTVGPVILYFSTSPTTA